VNRAKVRVLTDVIEAKDVIMAPVPTPDEPQATAGGSHKGIYLQIVAGHSRDSVGTWLCQWRVRLCQMQSASLVPKAIA
jgi:hypothetical protein